MPFLNTAQLPEWRRCYCQTAAGRSAVIRIGAEVLVVTIMRIAGRIELNGLYIVQRRFSGGSKLWWRSALWLLAGSHGKLWQQPAAQRTDLACQRALALCKAGLCTVFHWLDGADVVDWRSQQGMGVG